MRRKLPVILIVVAIVTLIGFLLNLAMEGRLSRRPSPNGNDRHVMTAEELKQIRNTGPSTVPASQQSSTTDGQSWTGIAESRKVGPFLSGANVYVELSEYRWPDAVEGKRVVVTGRAVVRHDLPVFHMSPKPLPPGQAYGQGIPVPEGTDLYKASERTVIEDARWHSAAEPKRDMNSN